MCNLSFSVRRFMIVFKMSENCSIIKQKPFHYMEWIIYKEFYLIRKKNMS